MGVRLQFGNGLSGPSIMKFTLTYDGELRSNSRPSTKWEIRKQISPQLQELWRVHPVLQHLQRQRTIPAFSAYPVTERHHSADQYQLTISLQGGYQEIALSNWATGTGEARPASAAVPSFAEPSINLCAPVIRKGWSFIPLVRDNLALRCGLRVIFLRKEEPGRVYQGGDMDNRLKTLFDALSIPNQDQIPDAPITSYNEEVYCLLEDDSLISGLNIETSRLLTKPGASEHEVRLVIEVDVRVIQARTYNQVFLGD